MEGEEFGGLVLPTFTELGLTTFTSFDAPGHGVTLIHTCLHTQLHSLDEKQIILTIQDTAQYTVHFHSTVLKFFKIDKGTFCPVLLQDR